MSGSLVAEGRSPLPFYLHVLDIPGSGGDVGFACESYSCDLIDVILCNIIRNSLIYRITPTTYVSQYVIQILRTARDLIVTYTILLVLIGLKQNILF